jgi:hypothetical protein
MDRMNFSLKTDFTEIETEVKNLKKRYEHDMRLVFEGKEPSRTSEIVSDYIETKREFLTNRDRIEFSNTANLFSPSSESEELFIMFTNDNVYNTTAVCKIIDYDNFIRTFNKIVKNFECITLPKLDRDRIGEEKFFDAVHNGKYRIPDRHSADTRVSRIMTSVEATESYQKITEFERMIKKVVEKLEGRSSNFSYLENIFA